MGAEAEKAYNYQLMMIDAYFTSQCSSRLVLRYILSRIATGTKVYNDPFH